MRNIKFIKFSGFYHLLISIIGIFFSNFLGTLLGLNLDSNLMSLLGIFYLVFGAGYFLSAYALEENWSVIFIGFVQKILFVLFFIICTIKNGLNSNLFIFTVIDSFLFIIPFYFSLDFIFKLKNHEDEFRGSFVETIKNVRTNTGENLFELSNDKKILMVFIRHFGCTFCRETVSEISNIESKIKDKGLTPVFVHLSDPSFGDNFFGRYFDHPVIHISDPTRRLYRALRIKRGNLWQLYGLPTWYRGIIAGVFKGHGGVNGIEGDEMQLGAYFILDKGQIVFSHYNGNASEQFDLSKI